MDRPAYPTDVSDEEWAFAAPYLTLMTEDAPQREYPLQEMFNALADVGDAYPTRRERQRVAVGRAGVGETY